MSSIQESQYASKEDVSRIEDLIKEILEVSKTIDRRVDSLDATAIKQEKNLEHHMYRTELLEKTVQIITEELKPIKKQYSLFDASFKIIGVLVTGAGIIAGIVSAFNKM